MDEVSRAERAEWLAQRPARDMRESLRTELEAVAQPMLEVACERSIDPAVRGAYERVVALKDMLRRLSE